MKSTVVPAQVTTVEDRITGSLSISQLLLLTTPIFIATAIFFGLPRFLHFSLYKLLLIGLACVLCGSLAIRIKGKIVLFWLIVLVRYNLRPRYFLYNKNSLAGRDDYSDQPTMELEDEPVVITQNVRQALQLTTADLVELERIIADPAANLSFVTDKKGKLHVHITEIK